MTESGHSLVGDTTGFETLVFLSHIAVYYYKKLYVLTLMLRLVWFYDFYLLLLC